MPDEQVPPPKRYDSWIRFMIDWSNPPAFCGDHSMSVDSMRDAARAELAELRKKADASEQVLDGLRAAFGLKDADDA